MFVGQQVPRERGVVRAFATQLAANHGQFQHSDLSRSKSHFLVSLRQRSRPLRFSRSSNCQVRIKSPRFLRKTKSQTFFVELCLQLRQLSRVIIDPDPQDARYAVFWKRAGAFNHNFKRRKACNCIGGCLGQLFYPARWDLADEFEREVNILGTAPTCRRVRRRGLQTRDVLGDFLQDQGRQFDCTKNAPRFVLGFRHGFYFLGARTVVVFVAFAIAGSVKGNSRGVTARQSAS